MKKLLSFALALILALSLPLAALAESSWVLPYNSILRYMTTELNATPYTWTSDSGTRDILVAAAMMDVASNDEYWTYCTSALDYGSVYVAYAADHVTIFFFSYYGCLMLDFIPSTMQLKPAFGAEIMPSGAISLLLDGKSRGVFIDYWRMDKQTVLYGLMYCLQIAESLGWDQ